MTKEYGESTVSKILELVEDSALRMSKSENYIARIAKVYTPAVCYGAMAILALGIKALCLILSVFGIVNMWLAIFADVGVMVLAVFNAMRAMYVKSS